MMSWIPASSGGSSRTVGVVSSSSPTSQRCVPDGPGPGRGGAPDFVEIRFLSAITRGSQPLPPSETTPDEPPDEDVDVLDELEFRPLAAVSHLLNESSWSL